MSLKLNRIELKNIRSHESIVFEPELSGVTTISGPNGTGKSTIVDSLAWALYGTKPNGVSKGAEIFRSGIGDKDQAYAIVDIELDGKPLRIERRRVSKGGSVECEISEIIGTNPDGTKKLKNLAGPAVSHAELYIKRHLKMDEKGFLAAVLVQQKQVDQLISAIPRERGAVIEKLTGIAAITAGLVASRQEYNVLRKSASFASIDPQRLATLESELQTTIEELESKQLAHEQLKSTIEELITVGRRLREKFDAATSLRARASEAASIVATANSKIEAKAEELASVNSEREQLRKSLGDLASGTDASKLEESLNRAYEQVRATESSILRLESDIAAQDAAIIEARSHIDGAGCGDREEAEKKLVEVTARAELHSRKKELRHNEAVAMESEAEQLQSAIEIIAHGEACPTCLQTVSDPKSVIAALTDSSERLRSEANKKREKFANHAEKYELSLQEETLLKAAVEAYSTEINATARLKELKKELHIKSGELVAQARAHKSLNKSYQEVSAQEERKASYDRLLKRAKTLTADIEKLETAIADAKSTFPNEKPLTDSQYEKLQSNLENARAKHHAAVGKQKDANADLRILSQAKLHTEEKITTEKEEIKKYKNLLQSVEDSKTAVELLADFREERIKNSIPVIEIYASDLINRFTEGKFTRLTMDGKFNTAVILADGTKRSVGLLSGGELSAASMALRLAISMLLNSGGGENLIVLDEVLVSQDPHRAELILTTVREVCRGQVVLIAHNDSIDAVADKVVTLKPVQR